MRVLITGATRGLGLATARAVASRGADVLVAGRGAETTARVAEQVGGTAVVLDMSSPRHVREVAASLPPLDAVTCNAGLQIVPGPTFTDDGIEETFAVNVLGHVALIDTLFAAATAPHRVVLVGSGTHDPAQRTGVPKPNETADVGELAHGRGTTSGRQRYSTTKLHDTALAAAYAREHPATHWACLDPGLMPGTGLARDAAGWQRLLWRTVLRALVVLPVVSTPVRSGTALARLLLDEPAPVSDGSVVDVRLRPGARSRRAADPGYQDAVLAGCRELLRSPRS